MTNSQGEAPPLIYDHAPQPGPQHWSWRCLVCSEAVSDHAGWFARWRHNRVKHDWFLSGGGDWEVWECRRCGRDAIPTPFGFLMPTVLQFFWPRFRCITNEQHERNRKNNAMNVTFAQRFGRRALDNDEH